MHTWQVCAGIVATAFAWEVLPAAVRHYAVRSAEVGERAAFIANDMATMVDKYPTFMTDVASRSVEMSAEGTWWPVLERAWHTNSVVTTLRALAYWVANNFLVRMLSPQTTGEYLALAVVGAFMIFVVANLLSHMYMARAMAAKMPAGK